MADPNSHAQYSGDFNNGIAGANHAANIINNLPFQQQQLFFNDIKKALNNSVKQLP